MCPWRSQDVYREFDAFLSNQWAYRRAWKWNLSLFAPVIATGFLQQTASAQKARGFTTVACVCVSRGFWERSVNAMTRLVF